MISLRNIALILICYNFSTICSVRISLVQPLLGSLSIWDNASQSQNERHSYRTCCGKVIPNLILRNVPSKNLSKHWYFLRKCMEMCFHGNKLSWAIKHPFITLSNVTPLASYHKVINICHKF